MWPLELDQQHEDQSSNDQQQSDNDIMVQGFDFLAGLQSRSDVSLNNITNNNKKKRKKKNSMVCKRCDKEFPTLQALGGHQTAHKKEREAEKRSIIERKFKRVQKTTSTTSSLETIGVSPDSKFYGPLQGISGFPPSWRAPHYLAEDGRVWTVGPLGPVVAGIVRPYSMIGGPTRAWVPQMNPLPRSNFINPFLAHTIDTSHEDDDEYDYEDQKRISSSVTHLDLSLKL